MKRKPKRKTSEDRILAKLEEIRAAIQMQGWLHGHICQPCTRPHYLQPWYPSTWYWQTDPTISIGSASSGVPACTTTGTYVTNGSNPQMSFTEGN
jgi:hypothetical protein